MKETRSLSKDVVNTTTAYLKEIKQYVTREAMSDEAQNVSEDSFS